MYLLSGKEFEAIVRLDAAERYKYFVKRVADWQELWSLWKDGWLLMGSKEREELVPVWPHPMFAEACTNGEWEGSVSKRIPLDEWLGKWIPGMEKERRLVAVFPTQADQAACVSAFKLAGDLHEEMRKFE